ncbi:MAG: hypothetical protein ABR557_04855 [Pyrinomonadaceae bacterium]
MRKIATQQKEERKKERGVWILKKDARYNYLFTKFSRREHRLILVTVVAHPSRVRYSDHGETNNATVRPKGSIILTNGKFLPREKKSRSF